MSVVTAEGKAVQSEAVSVATTISGEDFWWVTVVLQSGQTVNFRFLDVDARDGFYKELVTAMGA